MGKSIQSADYNGARTVVINRHLVRAPRILSDAKSFFFSELSLDIEGPILTSGTVIQALLESSGSAENLSGFHSQQSMQ